MDDTRHGLQDGDFVTFSEVKGLEELNGCEPLKVTVKGPYTFSIGDTTNLKGDYASGGIFTQVKMPKIIEFVSRVLSVSEACLRIYLGVEISPGISQSARVLHDGLCQV